MKKNFTQLLNLNNTALEVLSHFWALIYVIFMSVAIFDSLGTQFTIYNYSIYGILFITIGIHFYVFFKNLRNIYVTDKLLKKSGTLGFEIFQRLFQLILLFTVIHGLLCVAILIYVPNLWAMLLLNFCGLLYIPIKIICRKNVVLVEALIDRKIP